MKLICYSAVLCIQINSFRQKGRPEMHHFFEFLLILNKILIFLSVFTTIFIISGLTINIRSTVLKKGVFRSV